MALYINNKEVISVSVGTQAVNSIYYGNTKVYEYVAIPHWRMTVNGLGSSSPNAVTFTTDEGTFPTFEEVTDSLNNVFIKIPTFYRKVNTILDGQINSYTIANYKLDNTYIPYSCFIKPNGIDIMPYILIGKYCSTSKTIMRSISGTPTPQTIGNARSKAQSISNEYQLFDWQIFKLLQDLVCCFKNTINTNTGEGIGNIFNIEHLSYSNWLDGVVEEANSACYICLNPASYIDEPLTVVDNDYHLVNYTRSSSGGGKVISKLGYDENYPFFQFPTAVSDTGYDSYYCDGMIANIGPVTCNIGSADASSGIFNMPNKRAYWDSENNCARLCYRPINS